MFKCNMKLMSNRINVIILIVMIIILTAVEPFSGNRESFAATTTVLEYKWRTDLGVTQYRFKGYNGFGLCAYDTKKSPEVGTSGTVTEMKDSQLIKIFYYVMYKKYGSTLTKGEAGYSHIFLSYKLNGRKSISSEKLKFLDGSIEWAKLYNALELPPDYEQFRLYMWTPVGSSKNKQPIVFFSYVTPGSINLIKTSSDSKAAGTGMYHMTGTEYTVFQADRTTEVGKLIVEDESGKTNTIMVKPGKYQIRETKTPANSGFQINDTWLTADVKSGSAITLRADGDAAEIPIKSKAYIHKFIEDDDYALSEFKFDLVNTLDNSIRYSLSVGPGKKLISDEIDILAGTYRVSEQLCPGYESCTDPYEITVMPGETAEIQWKNRMLNMCKLNVVKENLDGMPTDGFKFRIKGILLKKILSSGKIEYISERNLNNEEVIEMTGLKDNSGITDDLKLAGKWTVDDGELRAINVAAEQGKTGDFPITLRNEAILEEANIPIEIKSVIVLKPLLKNGKGSAGKSVMEEPPEESELEISDGLSIKYNSKIELAGSRVEYLDEETGKNYSDITLNEADSNGIEVPFGRYTVTELMNSEQLGRYHDEDGKSFEHAGQKYKVNTSITRDITSESNAEDYTFAFKNIPRTARAALRKSSDDGIVGGILFKLKSVGITGSGKAYENNFTTDAAGNIDFGELYAGTYILEEVNFNKNEYVNTYPFKGYSGPAIQFSISGNEAGTVWIGGQPDNGGTSVGGSENPERLFINKRFTKLYLSKVDGDSQIYLPGVNFEIHDEDGKLVASFTLTRNDDGIADLTMLDACDGVEGGACIGAESLGDSVAADTKTNQSKEYVVIKGLEEGKTYTLIEKSAPQGYLTADDITFKFSNGMHIDVENTVPDISTIATDAETNTGMSLADNNVELIDSVSYSKLIPGREYVLKGTLMYAAEKFKSPEESAVLDEGVPVTSSVKFTPDSEEGVQEVRFNFDGSMTAGTDVVIFEELLQNDETIVLHWDPDNKAQTISMPCIKTEAKLKGNTIIDSVFYSNVRSGNRYVCRGWLVDTSTGDKIQGSDGFKVFYVEPGEESGTIDVELKLDIAELGGKSVTAYEELYLYSEAQIESGKGLPDISEEILVAEHKDIHADRQTVSIPKPYSPKTGDINHDLKIALIVILISSIAALSIIIRKRRA